MVKAIDRAPVVAGVKDHVQSGRFWVPEASACQCRLFPETLEKRVGLAGFLPCRTLSEQHAPGHDNHRPAHPTNLAPSLLRVNLPPLN